MRLSSSSEIMKKKLVPIPEIIKGAYRYWAHIDGVGGNETIDKHSSLVINYLEKIITTQRIDTTINNVVKTISNDKTELAEYIKLLFISSIAYHDLGKINPNFQNQKMKNPKFDKLALVIESQHSVLSAYLYLHYFSAEINNSKFGKDERILLFAMTHLFCYPISKHHSPYIGNEINFNPEVFEELFIFLNKCGIRLNSKMSANILSQKEKWINNISEEKQFAIFSLLKLAYSLLTACDYYATNEYMAGMKVDEFGILNKELKRKIAINFKSLKSYNSDLFARLNEYANKPFSELQHKSNTNLNFLRQKLTAEVITNLRANPDNPWYYIDAPTGAGKTNLSLACVSELLQTDQSLNKVFYVFPFTTLITQTFQSIQETIGLSSDELIQLHSKSGFHTKEAEMDGAYGSEKRLYLDNLFVNYPFCITSHVRFFEILKGNSKETNYLLHRLCNSIIVIDELQTYNPKHWSKIIFFIENYARLFNMRFIIMSATLPKIDVLSETAKGKFVSLTPNKYQFFTNCNFAGRVEFDFTLLEDKNLLRFKQEKEKEKYLKYLADIMKREADAYFEEYGK